MPAGPTLVIQTAFLGDVVLTIPLVQALAERHGPVDVLTTPGAASLIETHPSVRRVIRWDKNGEKGPGAWGLGRELRDQGYQRVYLPHRSVRSALIAKLTGAKERIGFADAPLLSRALYTETHPRDTTKHESVRFIALAPGSIWGTKRWPYYPELAKLLGNRQVVVIGGKDDSALADSILAAAPNARNSAGQLSLRESAALIKRAAALVTNDSSPLHLATAVGTPILAIFGSTVPAFGYGPIRPGDRVAELLTLDCRPCSSHGPQLCPLGHHKC